MIPTDIIKAINETALEAHVHQVFFAFDIDIHVEATNIHVLTHRYAACHVLDVTVYNIRLQIANVSHR